MTKEEALNIYNKLKIMHPDACCELRYTSPFELLVAVILSAQCTDKRVNIATEKLFAEYNTPRQFADMDLETLSPYIQSCGFFNSKGKNLIAMSKKLMCRHAGVVPDTMEELTQLDGVGRKTASVVLSVAFNIPAMPVDTHVNRLSIRLGFSEGKNVEIVEEDLKKILPVELWNSFHHYMIFHGRYVCHSQKPACNQCLLQKNCKFYENSVIN